MSLEEAKAMGAFASALALFQQQVVAPKENGHVSYKVDCKFNPNFWTNLSA